MATGNCEIQAPIEGVSFRKRCRRKYCLLFTITMQKERNSELQAQRYVVACQAIETSRLLLSSVGEKHSEGIGNHSGQLGKNLIFSAGGTGQGDFLFEDLT